MSHSWNFGYAMPNAGFTEPVENDFLAIVPSSDDRWKRIAKTSVAARLLRDRFTDQFARPVKPCALLIRADAPKDVEFYAVVCFRNAVAISSIVDGMCWHLDRGMGHHPLWTDYFDFYPYTASTDSDNLIGRSIALTSYHSADSFHGQKAPHLPTSRLSHFGIDAYVFEPCMVLWRRWFVGGKTDWATRAIFRSLEIACQAARMPAIGTRTPTIHDVGVSIALWVSALEILSHPRNANANLGTVLAILNNATWLDWRLRATRYTITSNKATKKVNLVEKLCRELYRARNDFLHGNPVKRASLYLRSRVSDASLVHAAPLVYRAALVSKLPGSPPSPNSLAFEDIAAYIDRTAVQNRYERALLNCR